METYDIIIVGGGPAGSTCAWQLKKAGLNIMVLDKEVFPRHKVCAGWITPAVLASLEVDFEDYAKEHIIQPITSFITAIIGGKEIRTEYKSIVSYGILRSEFDHFLLKRAGVRTEQGISFDKMEREGVDWIVNGKYRAPLIVGAAGHFCPVAKVLGAKFGIKEAAVKAQEVEFLMNEEQVAKCVVSANTPELFFCPDMTGYGWIFRKGDYLNIGLGRQDHRSLKKHVNHFVDNLVQQGKIPTDISEKFLGHAYLLYGETPRKIIDEGVLLIGDAAGLAYPQSGEGIRPAIESGLIAAQAIVAANKNYNLAGLQGYANALTKRLGRRGPQTINAITAPLFPYVKEHIAPKIIHFVGKKILSNGWASRHIVIDRWFLHNNQPALIAD